MSTPPSRVCVIGSGWQFTSGISYYTHRLAGVLAERYETSVILMRGLVPRRFYPGRDRVGVELATQAYPDTVRVFDGVDWFVVPSLLRAVAFLLRQRPDVVIIQWWSAATFHSYLVLAAVARMIGARIVIEFHEVQDTGEAQLPGVQSYARVTGGLLVRMSAAFVTHSTFDDDQIRRLHPIGTRPVRVIEHGPFDHHPPDESGAAERTASADFRFLFFGTIRPYKGLEYLVEAFDALSEEEAATRRLIVVGETWEGWTAPLERIAASRHRDRITLTNRYVSDAEVGRFFDDCDAVVLPYTRSSASGPLHIAMARGLPIVLSDVGGLRSGAAGYEGIRWVPPHDAEALAAALRDLPGQPRQRYADPRSWTDTLQRYRDLMASLPAR